MDALTKENIGIALAVVGAWPVFKGWFLNIWSWNRSRKLTRLHRERDFLVSINNSDRELFVFLLTSVLVVTAMLGASLLFHGVAIDSDGEKLVHLSDWLLGFAIYMFSVFRLGQLQRLKKFEVTIEKLDAEIRKLELVAGNSGKVIDGGTF